MAEYTIDNDANVFSIDIEHPHPWICRDDDGDYWTVFKNLSNNIEIHKSENNGETWTHKKTLTDSDFTGTPFPMDGFCIVNLKGQDKIYIFMYKKTAKTGYGWIINTSTDVGSLDLDGVSISDLPPVKPEVIWNEGDTKLYLSFGREGTNTGYHREIPLDGTVAVGTTTTLPYATNKSYGYTVDSNGDFFINAIGGVSHYNTIKKVGGTSKNITVSGFSYDFANLLCDYQDKVILGCVYSNYLHIYKLSNDLSTIEIDNANYNLGFTPSCCFMTIDGLNDIYFVYTNPNDDEAYSIKYDVSESSWGSPVKLSSDNDGLLVCPELKAPLDSSTILVTYQSTS